MRKDWLQRPPKALWRVRRLDESDAGDQAESNRPLYRWVDVHHSEELAQSAIIVVHPALAGYSAHEGFSPETGNLPFISTLPPARPLIDRPRSSLSVETYAEHIQRVLDAFQELVLPELRFAASALECAAGWSPGSVLRAAWLACLLHDVGKLSEAWQRWAHAYQQAIGQPVAGTVALAHTTFDFQNPTHRQAEQQVSRSTPRPRHAAEGALAVAQVLADAFNISSERELVQAILTAIARHHAPFVQDCLTFSLVPDAGNLIKDTLQFLPAELPSLNLDTLRMNSNHHQQFADLLIRPNHRYGWIAYTLLARALRRADQRGTEIGAGQTLS